MAQISVKQAMEQLAPSSKALGIAAAFLFAAAVVNAAVAWRAPEAGASAGSVLAWIIAVAALGLALSRDRKGEAAAFVGDPVALRPAAAQPNGPGDLRWEDLKEAIENGSLEVEYQPIMDAGSKAMVAVEALVRWRHPIKGLVVPDEFISLAEENDLIVALGEFVLRRACLDVRRWPSLRVAVNVSPIQFKRRDFVASVMAILEETQLDPERLELELTEGVLIDDAEQAENCIIELRAAGIRMALDDFGSGYSSLIYLRRFAFDRIKIDRSFLQSLELSGESMVIFRSIVELGRALGLFITAEGVETREQEDFLRQIGCNELQGYIYSPPLASTEIDARISEGLWRAPDAPTGDAPLAARSVA